MKYVLEERFFLVEESSNDDPGDLSTEANETETPANVEAEQPAAINFEVEFANAKTPEALEKFWAKFYAAVFKDNAKIIRQKFHTALAVYMPKYGWTVEENAILNWLVKGIARTPELFTSTQGYTFNYLMMLDKALSNSWIGPAELAKIGDGSSPNFGAYDILFHPDFIDMTGGKQAEWLKFRHSVQKEPASQLIFAYSSLLQANAAELVKEKEAAEGQSISKISGEKINLLLSKVKAKGPLVDITKALTRFALFTGKDLSAKPEAGDALFKTILASLKNVELVKQTFTVAYDVLPILVDNCFKSLPDNEKKALAAYRNSLAGTSGKQFQAAKTLLKLDKVNYTAKQVDELLYAIAAKDPNAKMPARVKSTGAT